MSEGGFPDVTDRKQENYAHCLDVLRDTDRDRYLACLLAPADKRGALAALYAFHAEIARVRDLVREALPGEIRLQWWRDALAEIAEGRPVRRHEVTTPLAGVIDAEAADVLDRLVAARRADCYGDPFEDAAAFRTYLDETAGGLMWVAARALGAADPAPVRAAGQAAGLAGFFLALPELATRGRQPLARLSEADLGALAQEGLRQVAAARAGRARIAPAARVALLAGWRAPGVLARAAADPARILAGGLEESGARKSLTLMRAAFRGMI